MPTAACSARSPRPSCLSDECTVFVTVAGPHDGVLADETP